MDDLILTINPRKGHADNMAEDLPGSGQISIRYLDARFQTSGKFRENPNAKKVAEAVVKAE